MWKKGFKAEDKHIKVIKKTKKNSKNKKRFEIFSKKINEIVTIKPWN